MTEFERFKAKFTVDMATGCWIWTAGRHEDGYGHFYSNQKTGYAHRWSYEFYIGPIPCGMTIDHLCRVRCCVNPNHLEPVTRGENVLRGISPSAIAARQTHCIHGHEFTKENTTVTKTPSGHGRQCRTCNNYRRRLKARQALARNDSV